MIGALLCLAASHDEALQRVAARLLEDHSPAVVAITVDRTSDPEGRAPGPVPDYFERPVGPCTGTIWSGDGEIVTSAWNVSGGIRSITVRLHDGRELPARLLGSNAQLDIALLRVDATDLPTIPHADLSELGQGSFVATIGRAPDPAHPTITVGIISAMNRHGGSAVGTDALQNYGNVGGPLLAMDGRLVGVTCHTAPQHSWGQSSGIGFACKVDAIEAALPDLRRGQDTERVVRAMLPALVAEAGDALRVTDELGETELEPGDEIIEVDGVRVRSRRDLEDAMEGRRPDQQARLRVRRNGEEMNVTVTLQQAGL